jgi:15-cis-phytoene synthase / lycopene beta-cyclase
VYKIAFLVLIAFVSTLPWDSYLVQRKIWTYPEDAIIGPCLFSVPVEELFFFIIQTYNTTLIYLILNKPVFHPKYLSSAKPRRNSEFGWNTGELIFAASVIIGLGLIWRGNEGTYLGLIVSWAGPFALLLWSLSSHFLMALPLSSTVLPIAIPTLYLWIVDTIALKRGTWVIESGTKLGIHLWEGLEIEEAVFFLATNILIVFGLVAFDHALSILLIFPILFPDVPEFPSPVLLVQALLTDRSKYGTERIIGIQEAVARLKHKSRSFYLASSVFTGRLRINLILL